MGVNEYIQIGTKIKRARIKSGLSQREMADKLNLAYSTYSNYENCHREPNRETISKICEVLDITPDVLFYDYLTAEEYGTYRNKFASPLTEEDGNIFYYTGRLNSEGKKKVAEYAKDLCSVDRYLKEHLKGIQLED